MPLGLRKPKAKKAPEAGAIARLLIEKSHRALLGQIDPGALIWWWSRGISGPVCAAHGFKSRIDHQGRGDDRGAERGEAGVERPKGDIKLLSFSVFN
eukprot:557527-Rhodomonas_salina.1